MLIANRMPRTRDWVCPWAMVEALNASFLTTISLYKVQGMEAVRVAGADAKRMPWVERTVRISAVGMNEQSSI